MACRYEISVLAFNKIAHSWAITLSTWRKLLYLHASTYESLFKANVMKLFSHYDTAPDIIHVEIHQRVLLQSSLMQPKNGMLIGWFSCPTHDCNNEWDRHWIADIYFREKINIENPHFDAHLNGTLLIKEVLPMYDGRYFIVRVQTDTGAEPNIYHLKVVQGNVYLLVILFYMLSPCVLLAIFCISVKENGVLTSLPIFFIFSLICFQSAQFWHWSVSKIYMSLKGWMFGWKLRWRPTPIHGFF